MAETCNCKISFLGFTDPARKSENTCSRDIYVVFDVGEGITTDTFRYYNHLTQKGIEADSGWMLQGTWHEEVFRENISEQEFLCFLREEVDADIDELDVYEAQRYYYDILEGIFFTRQEAEKYLENKKFILHDKAYIHVLGTTISSCFKLNLKMAKKIKIPFHKDGSILYSTRWIKPHKMEENFTFSDTLQFTHFEQCTRTNRVHFKSIGTGKQYEMFLSDFSDCIKNRLLLRDTITGRFTFRKQGTMYGIIPVPENR